MGVLKMHPSGVATHKIEIQADGSPQIVPASPEELSGSTQVCIDTGDYGSDVDVCTFKFASCRCLCFFSYYLFRFANFARSLC